MKSTFRTLAFAVAHIFLAVGLHAEPSVVKTRESITVGDETRYYVVSRPAELPPGKHPLLVGFHGYRGDVKAWLHEYTSFDRFIPEKGFIIAYPEGPVSWVSSSSGHDLPFFDALITELDKRFSVDRARIYVFGHSNGASFASFLLYTRPGVVAAVAVHSGIFPLGNHRSPAPNYKAPLLVIWGEKDEFSPAASSVVQSRIKAYEVAGFPVESLVLANWGHSWGGSENHVEEKILTFFFAHPMKKTAN